MAVQMSADSEKITHLFKREGVYDAAMKEAERRRATYGSGKGEMLLDDREFFYVAVYIWGQQDEYGDGWVMWWVDRNDPENFFPGIRTGFDLRKGEYIDDKGVYEPNRRQAIENAKREHTGAWIETL